MLAAWLLLFATTLGCLAYFAGTLRDSSADSRRRLGRVYFGLALLGVLLVLLGFVQGAPRYLGERAICGAFAGIWEPDASWGAYLRAWLDPWPACSGARFTMLWWLNQAQKLALALLTPGLVLGTISCLALPKPATREACRLQVRRLNTHLYLAAAVLVMGLLFLSALLRWPAAGLAGDAARPYTSHVDAYIFYWGVTYSVFIASYYVPVAIKLTRLCANPPVPPKRAKSSAADEGGGGEGNGDPVSNLFSLFKTLAALFAPAVAGLLGGVLNL